MSYILRLKKRIFASCTKNFAFLGPNLYIGGRYRKLSRDLSQTPWILNGKRMKEESVQEIICKVICPFFGLDLEEQKEMVIFMGSGREDVDVCLKSLISSFNIPTNNLIQTFCFLYFFRTGSLLRKRLRKDLQFNLLMVLNILKQKNNITVEHSITERNMNQR